MRFVWFSITLCFLVGDGLMVVAQPGPFITRQNSELFFPASNLTTNGITGLTNLAPRLMVSSVATTSTHGGSVSLVNTQAWVRFYSGINNDQASAVTVDTEGNVVVTGLSSGFGTTYDFATVKYSRAGEALWTNRYDGPAHGADYARQVVVDNLGTVYVTGDSANSSNGTDFATIAYSTNGTGRWTNRFSVNPTNYHNGIIAVDSMGNNFFAGGPFVDNSAFVTIKRDASGNALWTNYYKGSASSSDYVVAMALDDAGNIFVAGSSIGFATLKYTNDGTALWTNVYHPLITGPLSSMSLDRSGNVLVSGDSFVGGLHRYTTIKYSNDGVPMWTNLLAAPNYQGGSVPHVVTDVAGNVLITGGSPGADSLGDYQIVKLNAGGIPLWTNHYIGFGNSNGFVAATRTDSAGNFYLGGYATVPGNSNRDFIAAKFAADGTPLWTNRYNGPANLDDFGLAMVVTEAGDLYVTGETSVLANNGNYATVKYTDHVRYTPPPDFTGTDAFVFTVVDYLGNVATGNVTVVVQPSSLRFNTALPNFQFTTGGLQLRVDGALGSGPVALLASTNLLDWQPIATNLPVLGSANFLDSAAPNQLKRFYRARQ